jgi:hypothetical protein
LDKEKLLVLEGRILALQAINGVILNEITSTLEGRLHLRGVISHVMDRADFSVLPGYSESEKSRLAEGFFSCLNDVSDKIVVTD